MLMETVDLGPFIGLRLKGLFIGDKNDAYHLSLPLQVQATVLRTRLKLRRTVLKGRIISDEGGGNIRKWTDQTVKLMMLRMNGLGRRRLVRSQF